MLFLITFRLTLSFQNLKVMMYKPGLIRFSLSMCVHVCFVSICICVDRYIKKYFKIYKIQIYIYIYTYFKTTISLPIYLPIIPESRGRRNYSFIPLLPSGGRTKLTEAIFERDRRHRLGLEESVPSSLLDWVSEE